MRYFHILSISLSLAISLQTSFPKAWGVWERVSNLSWKSKVGGMVIFLCLNQNILNYINLIDWAFLQMIPVITDKEKILRFKKEVWKPMLFKIIPFILKKCHFLKYVLLGTHRQNPVKFISGGFASEKEHMSLMIWGSQKSTRLYQWDSLGSFIFSWKQESLL